jgi:hypothetical protein
MMLPERKVGVFFRLIVLGIKNCLFLVMTTSETHLPSPLKLNQTQPTIIDLDNDDEPDPSYPQQSSASMKIESLISGPK